MYFYVCRSIDVRKITEVTDLPDSEQNEENSCFNIITPDRTYEIRGNDKDEKLRYMAELYLHTFVLVGLQKIFVGLKIRGRGSGPPGPLPWIRHWRGCTTKEWRVGCALPALPPPPRSAPRLYAQAHMTFFSC